LSWFKKLEKRILNIEHFLYPGHEPKDEKISKLGYRQFSVEEYEVFYRIEGELVLICRVIHSSRDYQNLMTN
jgi:plasmid stabilization system protein ParE